MRPNDRAPCSAESRFHGAISTEASEFAADSRIGRNGPLWRYTHGLLSTGILGVGGSICRAPTDGNQRVAQAHGEQSTSHLPVG